jgi:hypothetical protein
MPPTPEGELRDLLSELFSLSELSERLRDEKLNL